MNTNERNTRSQAPSPEPHDLAVRLPSPKPEPAAKPHHPTSQPSPAPPQPGSPVPIPGTPDSPSPSPEPEVLLPEDTSSIQDLPYSNSAALMTEIDRRLTALEKSDDLIKVAKFLQQADQMMHEEDEEAKISAFKDRLIAIYSDNECFFDKYIDQITDETESEFNWEKLEHETRMIFQNSTSSLPPLSEIDLQIAYLKRIEDEIIMEGCKFEEGKKFGKSYSSSKTWKPKAKMFITVNGNFRDILVKIRARHFHLNLQVESEERINIADRLDILSQQQNPSDIDLAELENLEKSLDQIQLYYHVSGMDFKTMSTRILRARISKLKDKRLQKEIGLEAFSKVQANRRRDQERKIAAKVAAGELPLEARACGCCPETDPDEDPLMMIQGI